jgi:hypothetical protein
MTTTVKHGYTIKRINNSVSIYDPQGNLIYLVRWFSAEECDQFVAKISLKKLQAWAHETLMARIENDRISAQYQDHADNDSRWDIEDNIGL